MMDIYVQNAYHIAAFTSTAMIFRDGPSLYVAGKRLDRPSRSKYVKAKLNILKNSQLASYLDKLIYFPKMLLTFYQIQKAEKKGYIYDVLLKPRFHDWFRRVNFKSDEKRVGFLLE